MADSMRVGNGGNYEVKVVRAADGGVRCILSDRLGNALYGTGAFRDSPRRSRTRDALPMQSYPRRSPLMRAAKSGDPGISKI